MTAQNPNEEVLSSIDASRRDFIRKLVVGTTFAAPLLASFSMDGIFIETATAACNMSSNMPCAADINL